jgi:hypothetical protein
VPSAEENKAIARRFLEETAKESFDVVDELVAPDFVDLSLQPGQEPEREGFKRSLAGLIAPFSEVNIIIADQVLRGGRLGARGRHNPPQATTLLSSKQSCWMFLDCLRR